MTEAQADTLILKADVLIWLGTAGIVVLSFIAAAVLMAYLRDLWKSRGVFGDPD